MFIILNNVRSAWNVGSIMRTSDAVGAKLILIGYTPLPTGKTLELVKKTAIGAENTVPWEHFDHYGEVLDAYPELTHIGIEISATSQDLISFLKDKTFNTFNIALWFGNEIAGLEKDLTKKLTHELHLPMKGMKESLNVANTVCTVGYMFLEHSK